VIEYRLEFEEVKIFGNYAVEWGAIRGATREIASGRVNQSEYHVMRVLRRQPNGSWKIWRSIWAPAAGLP
jgi:ketosteroid isomerase-like protein